MGTMPRLAVTLLAVSALVVFLHAAEDCVTSANPGACFHSQGRFADARRHLKAEAERGDVNGMMNLAFYLNQGHGGPIDHPGSVKWWTEAARKGINEAQNNLAQAYRFGKGVRADQAAANRWLEMAAQGGHAEAQANLGAAQLRGVE